MFHLRAQGLPCVLGAVGVGLLVSCTQSSSKRGFSSSTTSAASSATPTQTTSSASAPAAAPIVPKAPANLATGPVLVSDPASGDFFDWPFPSDARRNAAGKPDLSGLPNPRSKAFIDQLYAIGSSETEGFSPTGPIYLRFDGAINAPVKDPVASLAPDYPVWLVNVDPASPGYLARTPIRVAVTAKADTIRPAHLLQVLPEPGANLRANTAYALIVLRSLGAPGTPWLGQSAAVTALLDAQAPAGPKGAELKSACAPLLPALPALRLHPRDVAAITVFTTGDPTALLTHQVAWLEQQPAPPTVAAPATRDVYPDFTALTASLEVPLYQDGWIPYVLSGGRQSVDATTKLPRPQGSATSPVQLSIPKGTMPAKGFPLYLYCHGTGGSPSGVIDRGRRVDPKVAPPKGSGIASYAALEGWGAAAMAGPFSPDRIGILAADGYLAYNFLNPVAMRDNFVQMVLEQVHFINWLRALRIDPALCPGTDASASPDGKVRFDLDTAIVGGQSLGSYLAGMVAATTRTFKGVVLTGAGGSWVEFAFGPKVPVDLQLVVELLGVPLGEKLDRFHPLIMAFDLAVGPADNTHYHRNILREPLAGQTPPHVLVIEGSKDLQVAVGLQRALTLAIGLDFVGPDPAVDVDEQILPVLGARGLAHVPYPFGGNRTIGGLTRTGVVVRYLEDGIQEGHYVSFQLDEPKRQVREFLRALKSAQVPTLR